MGFLEKESILYWVWEMPNPGKTGTHIFSTHTACAIFWAIGTIYLLPMLLEYWLWLLRTFIYVLMITFAMVNIDKKQYSFSIYDGMVLKNIYICIYIYVLLCMEWTWEHVPASWQQVEYQTWAKWLDSRISISSTPFAHYCGGQCHDPRPTWFSIWSAFGLTLLVYLLLSGF